MNDKTSESALDFVEGVGGRLKSPKSQAYLDAVWNVEGRNNVFLAKYMLASDLAYVLSAYELGITPERDAKALIRCLVDLLPRAETLGRENARGDIVLQRELWVVNAVGKDVASWLHLGRNRAESLRGSVPRLFFRDALHRERVALINLVRALIDTAEPVMEAVAPFYNHLQHAGRTSLGEYLLSWATNIHSHFDRIAQADSRLDLAPPPNTGREIVVDLMDRVGRRMGFTRVARLWQEVVITEEHFAEPFFVLVQISVALARLAEDLRLFVTSEFDFFDLADEHASTSSGRPQKKNPFGLQAVISGAAIGTGRLAAQLASNISVSEEAVTNYHAYSMFEFSRDVAATTDFMAEIIAKGRFKLDELENKSTMGFSGAREALDILVYEHKAPFRFAHGVMGEIVRAAAGGADHETLVALLKSRIADYPGADADELVRIMGGSSKKGMMLNLKAFHAVHEDLDESLRRLCAEGVVNPVEAAIERLMAEGKAVAS
jgi:argininosuccinate lyase